MARILSRALRALGSTFGIEGAQVSTDSLDLSSVQLVADTTLMAARGSAPGDEGGCGTITVTQTSTAGEVLLTVDPHDFSLGGQGFNGFGEIPEGFRMWITGANQVFAGGTISDYLYSAILINPPLSYQKYGSVAGGALQVPWPLFAGQTMLAAPTAIGTNARAIINGLNQTNFPQLLPRGGQLIFNLITQNVGNKVVRSIVTFMILPAGVTPP